MRRVIARLTLRPVAPGGLLPEHAVPIRRDRRARVREPGFLPRHGQRVCIGTPPRTVPPSQDVRPVRVAVPSRQRPLLLLGPPGVSRLARAPRRLLAHIIPPTGPPGLPPHGRIPAAGPTVPRSNSCTPQHPRAFWGYTDGTNLMQPRDRSVPACSQTRSRSGSPWMTAADRSSPAVLAR
jgi:hypothetical protein